MSQVQQVSQSAPHPETGIQTRQFKDGVKIWECLDCDIALSWIGDTECPGCGAKRPEVFG
jgi:hypothetical protein